MNISIKTLVSTLFIFGFLFADLEAPLVVNASQTTIAIEKPSYAKYLSQYTNYHIVYTPIVGQNGKYLAWPIWASGTSTNDLDILYETEVRAFSGADQDSGTYTGSWIPYAVTGMYGGDSKYSLTTNDYVEFSVTVSENQTIGLLPVNTTNAGYGYVTVDGVASDANLLPDDGSGNRYIDFYGNTSPNLYKNRRNAIPIADELSAGTYNIRITLSGEKNPSSSGTRIFIDGIVAYNTNGAVTDTIDGDFIITEKTQLTASGAWEYAHFLKKDGVGTYYGTYAHGRDDLASFTITLDGENKTLNDFDIFTGTNLNIAESSTIGDVDYPNIASVLRDYAFSSSGLDFENTTTWNNPLPVITSYWGMFPVLDGSATSTVGKFRGVDTIYDLTTNDSGFEGNLNTTKTYEYNSSNQRLYSLEITSLDDFVSNDQKMSIWDIGAPSYNKIYYYRQSSATIGSPYTPSPGEIWSSINKYRFYYDNTAPIGVSLSSPSDGSHISDIAPTLSWSTGLDVESEIDHYVLTIDGSDNTISAGTTSYTTSNLSVGLHTWLIKAYDYLGNYSTTASRSFTVDSPLVSTPLYISPVSYIQSTTESAFTIIAEEVDISNEETNIIADDDGTEQRSNIADDVTETNLFFGRRVGYVLGGIAGIAILVGSIYKASESKKKASHA